MNKHTTRFLPSTRRCKSPGVSSTSGSSRVWLRARIRVRQIRVQIPAKLITSVALSQGPNLRRLSLYLGCGSSRNRPQRAERGGKGPACLRAGAQSKGSSPSAPQGARLRGRTPALHDCSTDTRTVIWGSFVFCEVRLTFVKTYFTIISHTHLVL